ncbi:MAG: cellobiose phosphorylase [Candidatus Omnitrophica bacterium]|nr:cellobiose phosphorylase [Candidatus Omnitrophota bacterium]
MKKGYQYFADGISFKADDLARIRSIYFPLSGVDAKSIKSSITPYLSGDIKTDKYHYVTKPASREDLKIPVRNFFVFIPGKGVVSLAQDCDEKDTISVEAGPLWHKIIRRFPFPGLELEALNFVPVTGENVELMSVTVKNISSQAISYVPTASIPLFARSLANKHDHEHVTALLHRIVQHTNGVVVKPTMFFNEEGHKENKEQYFVLGLNDKNENPVGTFPTIECFCGDAGSLSSPEAVLKNNPVGKLSDKELHGKEAVGALRFKEETLKSSEARQYLLVVGLSANEQETTRILGTFNSAKKFSEAMEQNKAYWQQKARSISFTTENKDHDAWMHWVVLQPVFRRIFGCSFLPDHDYGKGGKGWRDIWQDLLSLILIEPETVRENLINNFGGVRVDGSNATIIGSNPGEFIADRNAITRVWMDHGVWPFTTLLLYIDQTGDYDIVLENNTYFRDPQQSRGKQKDPSWTPAYGNKLKDKTGRIYEGSLLEHILIQHLVQFFNVGEHNIMRLENADWNDGLDMAADRGESVTFMSFYAGNMLTLADLLEDLAKAKAVRSLNLMKEILILLDETVDYESVEAKTKWLKEKYFPAVQPQISGEKLEVALTTLVKDLRKKGTWIFEHIRKSQKISVGKNTWLNGYYDNDGKAVEGSIGGKVRMTLTGQVFPIMSGLAEQNEIEAIIQSVKEYLVDKDLGGVRLNTDFGLDHYLSLGRAFGFAYGTKENGAFFSHMTVMYAYALYKRGFVREGYEVLHSIYQMCADTAKSKIYPGIPEYCDGEGRGMYHYLTGSASWLVLTRLTQACGIRGHRGDLVLAPQLVKEEFDAQGLAKVDCSFAGKRISVQYINKNLYDFNTYKIKEIYLNDKMIPFNQVHGREAIIPRALLEKSGDFLIIKAVLNN